MSGESARFLRCDSVNVFDVVGDVFEQNMRDSGFTSIDMSFESRLVLSGGVSQLQ